MDPGLIDGVRRFNRTVTQRIRSLEQDGLAAVEANPGDGRVRTVRLTTDGMAERAELDQRSDAAAAALLGALTEAQRQRLVAAMAEVERLLVSSAVRIASCDPSHPDARQCLRSYLSELARRFDGGFDPALSISAADPELRPPAGLFLVATLHGEPAGCGALKFHGHAPAQIKRMWVAPQARGLGLGRRLLVELEAHAAAHGVRTLRLETNQALVEAISLYASAGFREVTPFNDEPYAHHWFEKNLAPSAP